MKDVKKWEESVLETFQAEIPSVYYSDKSEEQFKAYKENATYIYQSLLKFPPKMFSGCDLIDFGAGTGENTVYLANWGAKCTLVEMNQLAQDISKEVFQKYTNNYDEHRFICSSIFDYESSEQYDIVHSRGVLSHTDDKEGAFSKICNFLKPGGYLIFGDPNKAGSFQNMLQRYLIYKFGRTWDEMVEVAETLFKEDIDRSQSFVNRTRRTIIFDRWVVQKQNNPSLREVLEWIEDNGLKLYSSYQPIMFPFVGDSVHHNPKFDVNSFKDIGVLSEALWLAHTEDDTKVIPRMLASFEELAVQQASLTDYVTDCNKDTILDGSTMKSKCEAYARGVEQVDVTSDLKVKVSELMEEVKELFEVLESDDLVALTSWVKQTKHLFRGTCGVRHGDFIAFKPE